MADNVFIALAITNNDEVNLVVGLSDALVEKGMRAGNIINKSHSTLKAAEEDNHIWLLPVVRMPVGLMLHLKHSRFSVRSIR